MCRKNTRSCKCKKEPLSDISNRPKAKATKSSKAKQDVPRAPTRIQQTRQAKPNMFVFDDNIDSLLDEERKLSYSERFERLLDILNLSEMKNSMEAFPPKQKHLEKREAFGQMSELQKRDYLCLIERACKELTILSIPEAETQEWDLVLATVGKKFCPVSETTERKAEIGDKLLLSLQKICMTYRQTSPLYKLARALIVEDVLGGSAKGFDNTELEENFPLFESRTCLKRFKLSGITTTKLVIKKPLAVRLFWLHLNRCCDGFGFCLLIFLTSPFEEFFAC